MRFYEIDGGAITLDGIDISKMRRRDLRANMGMVLQDTWMFGGTIRENIAYGNLDATEEQILEAARATYVDRFVHSLPQGYDTIVDDEGGSVSAGEKQLLTIARAFLADPTILILDEATSSVDTRTEVLIQRAMAALRSNRTSFVIAHRLSTIRDADIILVMEHGQIVEQGNHEELLAADGAYARLYNAQFAAPAVEVAESRPVTGGSTEGSYWSWWRRSIQAPMPPTNPIRSAMSTTYAQSARSSPDEESAAVAAGPEVAMSPSGAMSPVAGTLGGGVDAGPSSGSPGAVTAAVLAAVTVPAMPGHSRSKLSAGCGGCRCGCRRARATSRCRC